MRSITRLGFAAAAALGLATVAVGGARAGSDATKKYGPILWTVSLEKAEKVALRDKKPVMMDLWAEWCGPCKYMLTTTYKDKDVVARSKRFVPVLVNIDEQPAIAKKFNVDAIPTVIFLDGKGRVLARSTGAEDKDTFLKLMAEAEKKVK